MPPSPPFTPPGAWQRQLRKSARRLGIGLTAAHLDAFASYLDLLLDWNRRVNLTAITEPSQVAALHFLDSLTCLAEVPTAANTRLCDVGSGAGFPGIPLAIVCPELEVTLLESVRKKCRFLEAVIAALGLPRVAVACRRAEVAGCDPAMRETFDMAITRAVAHLAVAAEFCLPLVKVGGLALVMKGPQGEQEVIESQTAIGTLGGSVERVRAFRLPTPEGEVGRSIIAVRKTSRMLPKYPRRPGIPARRPLGIDTPRRGE
jgi:16S rRNA (guanine527-N7)-methyltransferase